MLMGKYPHSIDAKNRLIIPSKLKEELGCDITIIKDADKCLCIYSAEEWEKYMAKLEALPKSQTSAVNRFLCSNAVSVHLDAQGRVLLPQTMIRHAEIKKNIFTVGCGKYAEIWAEEVWNERNLDEEPENYAEMLALLGL